MQCQCMQWQLYIVILYLRCIDIVAFFHCNVGQTIVRSEVISFFIAPPRETARKLSKYRVFSGPYFLVFSVVRIWKNKDQEKLLIWTLFMQWKIELPSLKILHIFRTNIAETTHTHTFLLNYILCLYLSHYQTQN